MENRRGSFATTSTSHRKIPPQTNMAACVQQAAGESQPSSARPVRIKDPDPHKHTSLLAHDHYRGCAGDHRGLTIGCGGVHVHHLSGFGRDQTHAARQHVNPFWIAQRGVFEAQSVVHFGQSAKFEFGRLDLITVLDGFEVLPGVGEDEQEQAGKGRAELLHLAVTAGILHLDQAGVVDRLREIDFRCARPEWTAPRCRTHAANCCYRCRHYAAPMKTWSPSVIGTCIAKIVYSSRSLAIRCCSARSSACSTVVIKSPINVPVYIPATSRWIPTTEPVPSRSSGSCVRFGQT